MFRHLVVCLVILSFNNSYGQQDALVTLSKGWWVMDRMVFDDTTIASPLSRYTAILIDKSDPCGEDADTTYVIGRKVYDRDILDGKFKVTYSTCPDYFHKLKQLDKRTFQVAFCTMDGKFNMELKILSNDEFSFEGIAPKYDNHHVVIFYKRETINDLTR